MVTQTPAFACSTKLQRLVNALPIGTEPDLLAKTLPEASSVLSAELRVLSARVRNI